MHLTEVEHITRNTLQKVDNRSDYGLWSRHSENLMLFTGMVESNYEQVIQGYTNRGTGRGYWQVEPNTAYDNIQNFLISRKELRKSIEYACEVKELPPDRDRLRWMLTTNMAFGICMARIWYWRSDDDPIPNTLEELASYWNYNYNLNSQHGTNQDFISAANRVIKRLDKDIKRE